MDRGGAVSISVLLEGLKERGALVWVDGDRLRYSGPESALTPEALQRLKEHKTELLVLLTPQAENLASPQPPSSIAEATEATNPSRFDQLKLERATKLGLIAKWAGEFGFVSIHDPTTGEWHDLHTKEAPDWARREAHKRKGIYRSGNSKAYRLTSREMEEIWEAEYVPELEGIVEDHPIEDEDGLGTG
jgi:hypothetical protein